MTMRAETAVVGKMADAIQSGDLHCHFTPTALIIDADCPMREWERIGSRLRDLHRGIMWWVGDWMNHGERAYGEKYSQAIESTGYDYGTVSNAAWVANRIESSRRHESLAFSHHQAVAPLPPGDQDTMLAKAAQKGWKRDELREAVKALLPTPATATAVPVQSGGQPSPTVEVFCDRCHLHDRPIC